MEMKTTRCKRRKGEPMRTAEVTQRYLNKPTSFFYKEWDRFMGEIKNQFSQKERIQIQCLFTTLERM